MLLAATYTISVHQVTALSSLAQTYVANFWSAGKDVPVGLGPPLPVLPAAVARPLSKPSGQLPATVQVCSRDTLCFKHTTLNHPDVTAGKAHCRLRTQGWHSAYSYALGLLLDVTI